MGIVEKYTGIRIECPECGSEQDFSIWFTRFRLGWNFIPLSWKCGSCRTELSFTGKGMSLFLPCLLFAIFMIRMLFVGIQNVYPDIELAAGRGTLLQLILILSVFPLTLFISAIFKKTIYRVIKTGK